MENINLAYSVETHFHWAMNIEDNFPSPTACGEACHPMNVLWLGSSIRSYQGPMLLCAKCAQIAEYYKVEHWTDIPDQPINPSCEAAITPRESDMRNTNNHSFNEQIAQREVKSPSSISRPFTPAEFLSWLSWHETHGDVSIGEIHKEAESVLRSLNLLDSSDARSTLAR